jgi:uncharacterized protein Usg
MPDDARKENRMVTTISGSFGCRLTTAETHHRLPDQPSLLQLYVWQEYDLAPDFPELKGFLDYWGRELEGSLHSVRVAHYRLIKPSERRALSVSLAFGSNAEGQSDE